MLTKKSFEFLKSLKENNTRPWFEENRNWYESTKEAFESLVADIISGVSAFDKDIVGLQVKHCTFRQYRDVRFSKDKRPYKINMGAYLNKGGKKVNTPGYYLHLEPGNSILAGGLWMPEAVQLAKVRQEIDYNFEEWTSIFKKPAFKKYFQGLSQEDKLQRPPKGYDDSNPALEYLKLKSFIARRPLSDDQLMVPTTTKDIIAQFKAVKPLIDFLNRAIE